MDTQQGQFHIKKIRSHVIDEQIDRALGKGDVCPILALAEVERSLHNVVSYTLGSQLLSPLEKVPTRRSKSLDGLNLGFT